VKSKCTNIHSILNISNFALAQLYTSISTTWVGMASHTHPDKNTDNLKNSIWRVLNLF